MTADPSQNTPMSCQKRSFIASALALATCAIAVFAVSCGGGGGSSVQPAVQPPSPSPSPASRSCTSFRSELVRAVAEVMPIRAALVPERIGQGPSQANCPPVHFGQMRCMALMRTDISPKILAGYAPADLQAAYGLAGASGSAGGGQIVAIVDAYDDPNAEGDLSVYRSMFALPACTTANGCFLKVNQSGMSAPLPGTDSTGGWEAEESLDVDMVSAICPNCKILLVEANTSNNSDLYGAEDTAAVTCHANEISDSWNGNEYSTEGSDETHFNHPGIMITVAGGDMGYNNPNEGYPATSQYVTSVGGTTLTKTGVLWSETAWSGTGSRCSQFIVQPSWQTSLGAAYTSLCKKRINNDVASDADPNTGVATYDTFGGKMGCLGMCVSGGTSAAAPVIAAVYALAGNGATLTAGSYPYSHAASLNDITTGSNGSCGNYQCTAEVGYDGPTGLGTPKGLGGF